MLQGYLFVIQWKMPESTGTKNHKTFAIKILVLVGGGCSVSPATASLGHEPGWDIQDVLPRLGWLVLGAEHSPPVAPGVEARPVPQVVPGLLLKLHSGPDFFEFPCDVRDSNHCDHEEHEGLQDNVQGQDGLPLHDPGHPPPLSCRVGSMHQSHQPHTQHSPVPSYGRHPLSTWDLL